MYRAIKNFHNINNPKINVKIGDLVKFNDPKRAEDALNKGLIEPLEVKSEDIVEFDPEAKQLPKKADKKQTREV